MRLKRRLINDKRDGQLLNTLNNCFIKEDIKRQTTWLTAYIFYGYILFVNELFENLSTFKHLSNSSFCLAQFLP